MTPDPTQIPAPAATNQRKWLWGSALGALAGIAIAAWIWDFSDLAGLISMKTIGLNYDLLKHHVASNFALSMVLYVASYAALAVFFLPGSPLFVVASGLLFGVVLGTTLASLGSSIGTTLAFLLARTLVGRRLTNISSPAFVKLKDGFRRHALSYMLFLRLTPGLPFAVINIGPSLIGVPLSTFVIGTFFGLLPSRIALSTAGAGLAQAIDAKNVEYSQCLARLTPDTPACPYDIPLASLLTKETVAAFVALAFLALLPALMDAVPLAWQRWQRLMARDRP
jgi:uncharacterized membrane protein YdjX (TVP38/TMEM64 family)